MGRGVSSGGGQSSLGYLFGSGQAQAPKPATNKAEAPKNPGTAVTEGVPQKPAGVAPPAGVNKEGTNSNNYFRADGQNCGNFLTDRPSTKVHAAPGGGSSLDYLFGGGSK